MTAETESLLPLSQALLLPRIAIESTTPVIDPNSEAAELFLNEAVIGPSLGCR